MSQTFTITKKQNICFKIESTNSIDHNGEFQFEFEKKIVSTWPDFLESKKIKSLKRPKMVLSKEP